MSDQIILTADDTTAAPLVAAIKSSVNSAAKYAAYVAAHGVTRDTVKHHAVALAALTYPNDEPIQKKDGTRTRFGNAVQAAGKGLRTALGPKENTGDTDYLLRVAKAVEAATNHDKSADQILAAVFETLGIEMPALKSVA